MKMTRVSMVLSAFMAGVIITVAIGQMTTFAQDEGASEEAQTPRTERTADAFLQALKDAVEVGPKTIVFTVPVTFEKKVVFEEDVAFEKDVAVTGEAVLESRLRADMLEAEELKLGNYQVKAFLAAYDKTITGLLARIAEWRKEYKRPEDAAYDWYTVETFAGQALDMLIRGTEPAGWE